MTEAAAAEIAERPRRKPPQRGRAGGRPIQRPVRFTAAELAIVEARAQAAGLSLPSYMRAAALGTEAPRARRRPTIDRAALLAATAELNRVGNNVNQIARALNRGRDAEAVAAVMAELLTVLAVMREARRG